MQRTRKLAGEESPRSGIRMLFSRSDNGIMMVPDTVIVRLYTEMQTILQVGVACRSLNTNSVRLWQKRRLSVIQIYCVRPA